MSVESVKKLMNLRNLALSRSRQPGRYDEAGRKVRGGDKHWERAEDLQEQINRLMCPVSGYKLYPDNWPGDQINLFGGDDGDTQDNEGLREGEAQGSRGDAPERSDAASAELLAAAGFLSLFPLPD